MKKITFALLALIILLAVGCSMNVSTIGDGPQKNEVIQARQWYILYGLVPLNNVDTKQMAGDAKNYEIKTEQSGLDILMNLFTNGVTVTSRTVTVTK